MNYCENCNQHVTPVKKRFSWGWFWVWTLATGGVLVWFYPLCWLMFAGKHCPMCHNTHLSYKKR